MTSSVRRAAVQMWHESARRLALRRTARDSGRRDFSQVAVVAALSNSNGITRGAQLQCEAMSRSGVNVQMVDAGRRRHGRYRHVSHRAASAYVLHMAAPETAHLLHSVLPEAERAWRVGYWAWELPQPPRDWAPFGELVHEIWTPSTYSARSLGTLFPGPVRVVPHRVPLHPARVRDNAAPFTVLAMADSRSSLTRKNPMAAVDAFVRAFGARRDARLVLKFGGPAAAFSDLVQALDGRANVQILTQWLSDTQMYALYRSTDVLLSLHRAEGFGLPMLEAMAHGIPVVGTAWSGNTDFMSKSNSALVPYELVPVRDPSGIYGHGAVWADPDVGAASEFLRELAADQNFYRRLAVAGRDFVASHQHLEIGGEQRPGMSSR